MKKILLAAAVLITSQPAFSQSETAKPGQKATATYKSEVSKDGIATAFESNLAAGKVTLVKRLAKSNDGNFTASYSLKLQNNSFNNSKPYPVTLTRDAFETYFKGSTNEVTRKWTELLGYVQAKKLSLTDEDSWIKAVNYFNSL